LKFFYPLAYQRLTSFHQPQNSLIFGSKPKQAPISRRAFFLLNHRFKSHRDIKPRIYTDYHGLMKKICKNCKFITYAKGSAPPLPLCLNKHLDPANINLVTLTETCRNFKPQRTPRRPVTQPADPSIRLIPLTRGRAAIVDAADYETLSKFKWYLSKNRSKEYAAMIQGPKRLHMHRYIKNPPKGLIIDHIDGNGLNNTRKNLRICTHSQNNYNKPGRKNKSSKYKGVSKTKYNKWAAFIGHNYKNIYLGEFTDEIDAAKAYDTAAKKYHKQFAYLNFPEK